MNSIFFVYLALEERKKKAWYNLQGPQKDPWIPLTRLKFSLNPVISMVISGIPQRDHRAACYRRSNEKEVLDTCALSKGVCYQTNSDTDWFTHANILCKKQEWISGLKPGALSLPSQMSGA